jgi:signal transduction histidine kinase/CheY-like chemotaxis protein
MPIKSFLAKHIINVVFLCAVGILIACSLKVYKQVERLMDANSWVIHTHQVIEKTNSALLDVIDGERLEQNYMNTKDNSYLTAFQADFYDVQVEMEAVRSLLSDTPSQLPLFNKLETLVKQRLALLHGSDLGKEKVVKPVPLAVSLSDQIKKTVSELNQKEYLLLEQRNEKAVEDAHETFLMVVIFCKVGGVLLLLSFLLLNYQENKHIAQQQKINRALHEQNERVQEATRLKSEFLANMSHELRTPLNAIIGFSELMQDRQVGPVTREQQEFLSDILISARHLLQLINGVLDLAKVESGKMEFHPEEFNIAKVVEEVLVLLRPLLEKKRVYITKNVDSDMTTVFIDPSRFKQVLYNYLSNALKFTPELGSVKITVRPENHVLFRLEVEDNGIGIKPEDLKRLFVEFQQLDSSAAKKYAGTGLGLVLTKQIVEAQGGQVGVISAVGEGSVFYAVLPRDQRSKKENVIAQVTSKQNSHAPKALLIESAKATLDWMASSLLKHNYNVKTVPTGADAMLQCESQRFALIVLDLMLIDINGYDLLKKIRVTNNKNTPVIIIVSTDTNKVPRMILISEHLVVPVEKDSFMTVLQQMEEF